MRTMKQWKLYLRLYWSTFLSYFKKKEKNQDVFIYEDEIKKNIEKVAKKPIDNE